MNFKNNLLYGLGLSLALLLVSSVASFISIKNLIESSSLVQSSNRTIRNLDNVMLLVKDAETGQRGYLLTKDDRFLEPYTDAKDNIDEALRLLSAEFTNSPTQISNLNQLKASINKRIEVLDENLATSRRGEALATDRLLSGKNTMDDIRRAVALIQAEEISTLQNRTQSMEQFASYTPLLIILSAFLAIVITLVFYRKVYQNYYSIANLTQELEHKNEETENRLVAIEKVAGQISSGDYDILWDENAQKTLGAVAGISVNLLLYGILRLANRHK